ncbi:MAG TPA: glycosyltransferase [Candidatus Limnocylindria bacterium]|nr:glycosyltransferase [Candidatus Limnocylindria bacterium]
MPALSLVIPAYNEEERLAPSLTRVRSYLARSGRDAEVIVVDDGSTDGTPALVRERAATWPALRLARHERNRGKGAAVRTGIAASTGDLVAFADADLSAPIEQLDLLLQDLSDCEIAIMSRALPGTRLLYRQSLGREGLGKLYAVLVRILVLRGIPDPQCGLKLYKGALAREIFAQVRDDRVVFDTEALLLATRRGARISQRPAVWRHDPASRLRFGMASSIAVGVALLAMKLRYRVLVAPRAVGPIRTAEQSAYGPALRTARTES